MATVVITSMPKPKVVFIMGATGTGKSKLAVDIATRFSGEVVNSDKIQLHDGLPVLTNKVTPEEAAGIPHHLIGVLQPEDDCTAEEFRLMASSAVAAIIARGRLPVVAGGSNSFLEELVEGVGGNFKESYDICYIWIDVALPELYQSVADRVEKMVQAGLVEEVRGIFRARDANYSKGILRAIGVPEMDGYFRLEKQLDQGRKAIILELFINLIKSNTKKLVESQLAKITRLKTLRGWNIHRIDATEVFRKPAEEAQKAWEEVVLKPALFILTDFFAGKEKNPTYPEDVFAGKDKNPTYREDVFAEEELPASAEVSNKAETPATGEELYRSVVP